MNGNCAAIDLGSNSCRMTIADREGNIIFKDSFATKLAEGLFASGRLSEISIERAVRTFCNFNEKIKEYGVKESNIRAVATAACRMAENSKDLQQKIKEKTNINLEIIDEKEEAELNLLGGIKHVAGKSKYVVLYDLGGGSTEITLATNDKNPEILHTISIPWGARNATEAFGTDNYTEEKGKKLAEEINGYVKKFVSDSKLAEHDDIMFVATSSTPLRISSLLSDDLCYEKEKCDGRVINCEKADKLMERLLPEKPNVLAQDTRIGENRAPIFAAACIIFQAVYKGIGAKSIVASLASAQDGIIRKMREKNNEQINKISKAGSW